MRPLRSLKPLERFWAAGGAGAGPGAENATPAQPKPIGTILGSRGRGRRKCATPAQPKPIGTIWGSPRARARQAAPNVPIGSGCERVAFFLRPRPLLPRIVPMGLGC